MLPPSSPVLRGLPLYQYFFLVGSKVGGCSAWSRFGRGRHAAGLNLGDIYAYALSEASGQALLFKGDDFAQTDVRAVRV